MATYTSLINSVLAKLRESSIASPGDSAYSLLIGELINETKEEVEDAWKWNALRQTIQVTTSAGTSEYSITGSGTRFKLQNSKRSVYNTTSDDWVYMQPSDWMKEQILVNTSQGTPSYFYFEGVDGSGDTKVNFHPIPDGTYVINFNLVVPQDEFSVGTEIISVPSRPVILGAYAKAIAEKGEDNGKTHGEAMSKYMNSLSDQIAIDEGRLVGETSWYA